MCQFRLSYIIVDNTGCLRIKADPAERDGPAFLENKLLSCKIEVGNICHQLDTGSWYSIKVTQLRPLQVIPEIRSRQRRIVEAPLVPTRIRTADSSRWQSESECPPWEEKLFIDRPSQLPLCNQRYYLSSFFFLIPRFVSPFRSSSNTQSSLLFLHLNFCLPPSPCRLWLPPTSIKRS
jgi:hypothetical protein